MPDNWILGRTLAALRIAHGWSQEELAERAGMDKAQISRYERNENQPTRQSLDRLAKALNLAPFELHLWQRDLQELLERTAPGPPPRPAPPVVDWPLPVGRMPWQTEDEAPPGDDRTGDQEVDRLARETGRLAERFVRLHFRRLESSKE